jgi:hypothetical protein
MDSLVRLRQLNQTEVSGYTVEIIRKYLITGTGIANTGALTGVFYPLNSNPSGYSTSGQFVTTGQTGAFVDTTMLAIDDSNLLSIVSGLYYRKTNPSGYISQTTADSSYLKYNSPNNSGNVLFFEPSGSFYVFEFKTGQSFVIRGTNFSQINPYGTNNAGTPNITGFSIYSSDIKLNNRTVATITDINSLAITRFGDTSNTHLNLYDNVSAATRFNFDTNTIYQLVGLNGAVIDLYDEIHSHTRPYVSGFEIYADKIFISGKQISTGNTSTGVSFAQLTGASGVLDNKIATVQSQLAATGARLGTPYQKPLTFYLNLYASNFRQKGLLAQENLDLLLFDIYNSGENQVRVYVGSGDFGAVTFNCVGPACNLGNITFISEFNANPKLDFSFVNSSGNFSFIGPMSINLNVQDSKMRFSGSDPDKVRVSNTFSFNNFTGEIYGFGGDGIDIDGKSSIVIRNSKIQEVAAGQNTTGLVSLAIYDSEILETLGEALNETKVTIYNSLIAGRKKISDANGAPFLSFQDTTTSDQGLGFTHILPKSYGGLAYSNNDLYLTRNRTGTVAADLLISKESGDSLYYSTTNPKNYVDVNYVDSIYAPRSIVVYRGINTSNNQLVLTSPSFGIPAFSFDGDIDFHIRDTGSRSYIDFYGTFSGNSFLPYISGYQLINSSKITSSYISGSLIDATGINLNGVPIQKAISGVSTATGTFVSMIDDQHNQRMALWHTGTSVTGFYFSGGNGPYYLQNYNKAPNGAISYVNKIDLQNSTIDSFNFTSVKGVDIVNGNLGVTNGNVAFSNGNIEFLDGIYGSYVYRLIQGSSYYLKGNNNNFIDFYGSLFDNTPWITGFNIDLQKVTVSGGSGFSTLFSGQGGINVYQSGGLVIISGGVSSGVVSSGGGSGESNTASNLGSGSGIFSQKVGVDLRFKSISTGIQSGVMSGILISGDSNTLYLYVDTGFLVRRGESGQFYPRIGNPSGFALSSQTGNFITTSQTGAFYASSNPSCYINSVSALGGTSSLGSGLISTSSCGSVTLRNVNVLSGSGLTLTSQSNGQVLLFNIDTNVVYTTDNPSGYVRSNQTGILVGKNETGIFITTGQTGNFVAASQTGSFITTGQTGLFVGTSQTGSFATTGFINANYYPLNSNPSGYVQSTQTGLFALVSYVVGNFLASGPNTVNSSVVFTDTLAGISVFDFKANDHYYLRDSGQTRIIDIFSGKISGFDLIGTGGFTTKSYVDSQFLIKGVNTSNNEVVFTDTNVGVSVFNFKQNDHYYLQDSGRTKLIDIYTGVISGFSIVGTGNFATTTFVNSNFLSKGATTANSQVVFTDNLGPASVLDFLQGDHFYIQDSGRTKIIDIYTGVISGFNIIGTGGFVTTGQTGSYTNTFSIGSAVTGGSTILNPIFLHSGAVTLIRSGSNIIVSGTSNTGAGETNTASNLAGTSGSGIFSQKVGADLQFKALGTGSGIIISGSGNSMLRLFADTGYLLTRIESGKFVGTNQTGQFYASANPSNWVTSVLNGATAGFTGLVSTAGSVVTIKSLGAFSGIQFSGTTTTLSIYPDFNVLYRTSNPSGFISGLSNLGAGSGIVSGISGNMGQFKGLIGGSGIQISGNSTDLTIIVTGISSSSSSTYSPYQTRFFV